MELEKKIEAILFWKGESLSIKKLEGILKANEDDVRTAIENLKNNLSGRGVVLLEKSASSADRDGEIMLGTAPELSDLLEELQKEELNKDLSKSSLETLSIVLYKNGVSRGEVDFIRGVNSSFTLRALSVRGLVEKVTDPNDSRRYIYKPSFELLSYMGIKSVEELPQYRETLEALEKAEINLKDIANENNNTTDKN